MRKIIYFALLAAVIPAAAQQGLTNTFNVAQFPGGTVAAKLAAAQAQCLPDTNVPCVLILDPALSVVPVGSLPSRCGNCTWLDYRGGFGVTGTMNFGGSIVQSTTAGAIDLEVNHTIDAARPNGVFPLGGDIDIFGQGSTDLLLFHQAAKATASTSLSVGANSNVLVANISPTASLLTSFGTAASYVVGRGTPNEETVSGGNVTVVDATHFNLTLAKAHTVNGANNNSKPLIDIEQGLGNTVLNFDGGGYLFIQNVNPSQEPASTDEMIRIAGVDGVPYLLLPNSTADTFPRNAVAFSAPITGTGTIGAGGGQLPTAADLVLQNSNSANFIRLKTSAGANSLNVGDSFIIASTPIQSGLVGGTIAGAGVLRLHNSSTDAVVWENIAGNNSVSLQPSTSGNDGVVSSINGDGPFPLTRTVASGTANMTTAAISAGACGSTVTVVAGSVATTDVIAEAFNAAPAANPAELVVSAWPTSGNVNFQYCNPTAGSVTPSAATLNWRVIR